MITFTTTKRSATKKGGVLKFNGLYKTYTDKFGRKWGFGGFGGPGMYAIACRDHFEYTCENSSKEPSTIGEANNSHLCYIYEFVQTKMDLSGYDYRLCFGPRIPSGLTLESMYMSVDSFATMMWIKVL